MSVTEKQKELYESIVQLTGATKQTARRIYKAFDDGIRYASLHQEMNSTPLSLACAQNFGKDNFILISNIILFLTNYTNQYEMINIADIEKYTNWFNNLQNAKMFKIAFEFIEEYVSEEKTGATQLQYTKRKIEKSKSTRNEFAKNIEAVKEEYQKNFGKSEIDSEQAEGIIVELYSWDTLWAHSIEMSDSRQIHNIKYIIGMESSKHILNDEVLFNILFRKHGAKLIAEKIHDAIEKTTDRKYDKLSDGPAKNLIVLIKDWVTVPSVVNSQRVFDLWNVTLENGQKEITDLFKPKQDFVYRGIAVDDCNNLTFLDLDQRSEIKRLKIDETTVFAIPNDVLISPRRGLWTSSWTNDKSIAENFTSGAYIVVFVAKVSDNPDRFIDITEFYKDDPHMHSEQEVIGVGAIRVKQVIILKTRESY